MTTSGTAAALAIGVCNASGELMARPYARYEGVRDVNG